MSKTDYRSFRNAIKTNTPKFHFELPNGVVLFTTRKEYTKEMNAYNRA